jgi:hypothetical protein
MRPTSRIEQLIAKKKLNTTQGYNCPIAYTRKTIELHKSQFENVDIDLATAVRYRKITDENLGYSVLDQDHLAQVRSYHITYHSLTEHRPLVDREGFVWDGNHRLTRAIELGMSVIPVRRQV